MKASPVEQERLLSLQQSDTRIRQLEHAAASLPQFAQLTALQPQVDALAARARDVDGDLEDARTELSRVEADVEVVEVRMARDANRAQQSTSSKDAQALESEIASLRKRRGDLEDIELSVMERIETLEASSRTISEQRDELAREVGLVEGARDVELAKVQVELSDVRAERDHIAETIPDALVELYEKQRARYGIGAARLVRGVSMASNVALDGTDLASIRRAAPDDVVLCPDSGAVLVRGEDSGL